MADTRLVYSTDPQLNQRCQKCKEVLSECRCAAEEAIPDQITVKLRLEKAKRGGKTVTVLAGLPASKEFLRSLAAELKQGAGCGGTFGTGESGGFIEIQGDRRDFARAFLVKKGISVKG